MLARPGGPRVRIVRSRPGVGVGTPLRPLSPRPIFLQGWPYGRAADASLSCPLIFRQKSRAMPSSPRQRRIAHPAAPSLTRAQLEELDDFLTVNGASCTVQSVAALHGFLSAIARVPTELPDASWLPYVWSDCTDSSVTFDSLLQERRLQAYVARMYDDIVEALRNPDCTYTTLARPASCSITAAAEDWSRGFLRGMALCLVHWRPFLATPTGHRLLLPIVLLGAESIPSKWRRVVATAPKRAALAACLPAVVEAIAIQLLPVEFSSTALQRASSANETGCDEPCACGSGRPGSACCGAWPTLH